TGYERVQRLIADENPDLIGLVEVSDRWLTEIAPAVSGYPWRIEEPRSDNFGVAMYARGPIQGEALELGASLPSIVATRGELTVIVTHPLPPMNGAALAQQREQFAAVAQRARSASGPVIVMGDMNATPWSRPFTGLVRESGLCDTRAGFGLQASFPAASWVLRIPIDHVLVSCSVGVLDRRIGRDVGSDHLPAIVDLVVPR
ncbi:MAG TPA: endonuclease/exonuclease/phosphatase family protein, partial [Kofleriaceae bacterium]|nr:endonuclease/exonuclease/phosphatase family protein [Kofleriaceae bacterium]